MAQMGKRSPGTAETPRRSIERERALRRDQRKK